MRSHCASIAAIEVRRLVSYLAAQAIERRTFQPLCFLLDEPLDVERR